ncbi:hypothetical protein MMC07_004215 [Pseudocyphellaria aurata]|nr:hypothetical protein [Pseudocyphellaria aurata]
MVSYVGAEPPPLSLPAGLRQRQLSSDASDLSYYIIEAGEKGRPLIMLLHGFPELAFSWRGIMPALAAEGFYIVAFDQRGYGRTTGWDASGFDQADLNTFSTTNLVRDVMVLALRLGYHQVECIAGHDFGCVPAFWSAVARPDFFRHVVLMSHPFSGSPKLPFDMESIQENVLSWLDLQKDLSELPKPRKHYRGYYASAAANLEMSPKEGLHSFLRGYFHLKSADTSTDPQPIANWTASELAKLPEYYVMPLDLGMRETISQNLTEAERSRMREKCARWLPDSDLDVYVNEYGRTGFQGGLNYYRVSTDPRLPRDVDIFAAKKFEVPCLFLAGEKDWNYCQTPNSIRRMRDTCASLEVRFIPDAGHWVQQEQPQQVVQAMLRFLSNSH